jgi:predicted Zn-dependent protease
MVAAYEASDGDLTHRLLAALDAAQGLGGDFRGMQSAGLVVRSGERHTPAWSTALIDVRVDDHPEPLRELRRLVELATSYRFINLPFVRLASGDRQGALEAARRLLDAAPSDPNVQMRLGMALLAVGEPEGRTILSDLVAKNEKWAIYMRRSLQRFGIDPAPLLGQLGAVT